jgi:hypothetical protein
MIDSGRDLKSMEEVEKGSEAFNEFLYHGL